MNKSQSTPSARERDIKYLIHPYTNAVRHQTKGPQIIERGSGIYVYDDDGKEYIEGLSGLWSVAVGFSEPRLADAAYQQMQKLPFYHAFTHKSHGPVIDLAERLISCTEGRMAKAFFTNSGSEANDTVAKMLWFYNNCLGRPEKKKIIARWGGYHGITVASGSMTGLPWNHRDFDLPLPRMLHVSMPHYTRFSKPGETEEAFATRLADELEALILHEGPETVAAFIGEPLMGAGGVIVPPATYWEKIQKVCRKHDVVIVVDEVITGFGRLGTMFGIDYFDIEPDIMVLSKQLTSSYQPLAAILMNQKIFDGIAKNTDRIGTFGHGFTAGGHPVAAAVALENLAIIEERDLVGNAARMGEIFQHKLRDLKNHPLVGEVRGVGLVAGVELMANKTDRQPYEPEGSAGACVSELAQRNGLIVRNIQDTIALCPPLIINEPQLDELVGRLTQSLDQAYKQLNM